MDKKVWMRSWVFSGRIGGLSAARLEKGSTIKQNRMGKSILICMQATLLFRKDQDFFRCGDRGTVNQKGLKNSHLKLRGRVSNGCIMY